METAVFTAVFLSVIVSICECSQFKIPQAIIAQVPYCSTFKDNI